MVRPVSLLSELIFMLFPETIIVFTSMTLPLRFYVSSNVWSFTFFRETVSNP